MRAFTLDRFDSQPGLRDDLEEPTISDGELLVRVHASSVNPVDAFIGAGALKEMAEHEFPVILGRDYAGVVERVGSDVSGYAAGDEVFGFLKHASPRVHAGTWAELIAVPHDESVAAKPLGLDFAHAGAAPLAAITAVAASDAPRPRARRMRARRGRIGRCWQLLRAARGRRGRKCDRNRARRGS